MTARQSQAVSSELEAQLRAYFQEDTRFLGIYRTIRASVTEAGVVVHVRYSDGRWSATFFVGDCDPSDVEDMMSVLILELTQNGLKVFESIGDGQLLGLHGQESSPPEPFPATFHEREPVETPWERQWIPGGPIPSLMQPPPQR